MLLTSPSVSVERLYDESTYIDWAKKNVAGLFKLYPDAKKNGFYIMTSTYNTRRCATVAWSDPNKQVVLGFKTDVAGLGELTPSSEWYLSKQSEGVNYFEAVRSTHDTHCLLALTDMFQGEGDEKTVFFGGILFKARHVRVPVSSHSSMAWSGGSSLLLYRVMSFVLNATNNSDVSSKRPLPRRFRCLMLHRMERWRPSGPVLATQKLTSPKVSRELDRL
jgi:hypothetical protein